MLRKFKSTSVHETCVILHRNAKINVYAYEPKSGFSFKNGRSIVVPVIPAVSPSPCIYPRLVEFIVGYRKKNIVSIT